MSSSSRLFMPPLAALVGWLFPGAGYLLIGHRVRGIIIGVTIVLLFLFGLLLAGVRVIDVPGYDRLGYPIMLDASDHVIPATSADWARGNWAMTRRPLYEIIDKPWFAGQILTGPICIAASRISIESARPPTAGGVVSAVPAPHARLAEIGCLYTAIAGMLNLLAIIDSAHRAGKVG